MFVLMLFPEFLALISISNKDLRYTMQTLVHIWLVSALAIKRETVYSQGVLINKESGCSQF